ncbi:MAG: hypothetical protein AAB432_01835, partial [Patescibacteria group bacterium]
MPKFDSKKILIAVSALVILGAAFYFLYQANPALFMSKEAERAWRNNQEQQVASLVRAGDFDACANVNYKSADGVDYKNVCENNIALNKAIQTLDLSWCKNLDDKLFLVNDCELQVSIEKLTKKLDISFCNNISNSQTKKECEVRYWILKA